nr:unnamed protein product [Callosobruchus chinensis]
MKKANMSLLESFLLQLQNYLVASEENNHNIIRKHTKKLETLGDISFPLNIDNWHRLLDRESVSTLRTIFEYNKVDIVGLKSSSAEWSISVSDIKITESNIHLFLNRSGETFKASICEVLTSQENYGSCNIFDYTICIETKEPDVPVDDMDVSNLRINILKGVTNNFIEKFTCETTSDQCRKIIISQSPLEEVKRFLLCGPVLDHEGKKSTMTAGELFRKRMNDMRMMAQHKYGVQIKSNSPWEAYFAKLGRACVTIELLSNRLQKPIKIAENDLQTANKGPSFIFYNCARLSTLLREFDRRMTQNMYPELPSIELVDFSLLDQQEEWELLYVYIMQYPMILRDSVKDIEKGIFSPHNLVTFLSNLCSVFSVYYRRVRVLTDAREHLHGVIHAKIYLLKALQIVFHNTLFLLNIEPIKEM